MRVFEMVADSIGRSSKLDFHASVVWKTANFSKRGGWVFIFFRLKTKESESRLRQNTQGKCGKEKYWRGVGGWLRSGLDSGLASWDAECGMVLLCAFGGIRLQNAAERIVNGMSSLKKFLGGGA